jgi:hypothetical protein
MIGLTAIDHRQQAAEIPWVYVEPTARGIGGAAARAVVSLGFHERKTLMIPQVQTTDGRGGGGRCGESWGVTTRSGYTRATVMK